MSGYSALYIRTAETDYIFLANDTAAMIKIPLIVGDKTYDKTHSKFTSKNFYYQHLKSSIIVTGSVELGIKVHEFIEDQNIDSYDGLLDSLRNDLNTYLKDFIDNYPWDLSNKYSYPGLLGQIIVHGLSTLDKNGNKRPRNLLLGRRLHFLRDRVKDCGTINPETDDYEGNVCHLNDDPILPMEEFEKIADDNQKLMNENFYLGSMNIVKQQLIRSNELFNESDRERIFSAGEIHLTVFQCNKNDRYGDTLTVSQMLVHRFDDYEDIQKEQQQLQDRLKNGLVKHDVMSEMVSDTLNKIRKERQNEHSRNI
ncbi:MULTISPECIES: hypothetical protein [Sphingobacterium]|uniref:Conjugal transfer protein TraG n=1 Tax=Sphingobacterium tenebrionis TaxID=3111775 RepID=A0ABU8I4U2_9SPHI|nr:hypothetical protein [Sphingobacterium sp. CZ-2]QBR11480.1 hypothetical protein E3D81_04540 [Sphingobacterium sp. CZ-2]